MRRLIHVPILHDEVDLGLVGPAVSAATAGLTGETRWARHRETLNRFWEAAANFLDRLDARLLRLYQDGLPADGEVGRRIVEEAARRGSTNYRLILRLLEHGAQLRKTEDPALLWREHRRVLESVLEHRPQAAREGEDGRLERDRLLDERDRFIARTIDATLAQAEIGVLFLGAEHEIASQLAPDIAIEALRDPQKVNAYLQGLLSGKDDGEQASLAAYLSAPIAGP